MRANTRKRTTVERRVEMPELVESLEVPTDSSLDTWEEAEKKRIAAKYPVIKGGVAVVGTEIRDAQEAIAREVKYWETKRRLLGLLLLEETGYAKKAAGEHEDDIFAERRVFTVPEHEVDEYTVNAMWPARS